MDLSSAGLFSWHTVGARVVEVLRRLEELNSAPAKAAGGSQSDTGILLNSEKLTLKTLRNILLHSGYEKQHDDILSAIGWEDIAREQLESSTLPKNVSPTWVFAPKPVANTTPLLDQEDSSTRVSWEAYGRRYTYSRIASLSPPMREARASATLSKSTTHRMGREDIAATEYLIIPETYILKTDGEKGWAKIDDAMAKEIGPPMLMLYRIESLTSPGALISRETQLHQMFVFLRLETKSNSTTVHYSWVEEHAGMSSPAMNALAPWLVHTMRQQARRYVAQLVEAASSGEDAKREMQAMSAQVTSDADDLKEIRAKLDKDRGGQKGSDADADAAKAAAGAPGAQPSGADALSAARTRGNARVDKLEAIRQSAMLQAATAHPNPDVVRRLMALMAADARAEAEEEAKARAKAAARRGGRGTGADGDDDGDEDEEYEYEGEDDGEEGDGNARRRGSQAEGDAKREDPGDEGEQQDPSEDTAHSSSSSSSSSGFGLPSWLLSLTSAAVDDTDLSESDLDETWTRACAIDMLGWAGPSSQEGDEEDPRETPASTQGSEQQEAVSSAPAVAETEGEEGKGAGAGSGSGSLEGDKPRQAYLPALAGALLGSFVLIKHEVASGEETEAKEAEADAQGAASSDETTDGEASGTQHGGGDGGSDEAAAARGSSITSTRSKPATVAGTTSAGERRRRKAKQPTARATTTSTTPRTHGVAFSDGDAAAPKAKQPTVTSGTGAGAGAGKGDEKGKLRGGPITFDDMMGTDLTSGKPLSGLSLVAAVAAGDAIAEARATQKEMERQEEERQQEKERQERQWAAERAKADKTAAEMEAGTAPDRLPPDTYGVGAEEEQRAREALYAQSLARKQRSSRGEASECAVM